MEKEKQKQIDREKDKLSQESTTETAIVDKEIKSLVKDTLQEMVNILSNYSIFCLFLES